MKAVRRSASARPAAVRSVGARRSSFRKKWSTVARVDRVAAEPNRPVRDAEAMRDVVSGIVTEPRGGLAKHARQRGVAVDEATELAHVFHLFRMSENVVQLAFFIVPVKTRLSVTLPLRPTAT